MKKILIAVLLSSMFLVFSCGDDDENSLTSPTTNGKGTMSFLLNGKVWKPEASFGHFPYSGTSISLLIDVTEYDSSKNKANDLINVYIWARRNNKAHSLEFKVYNILHEGKYQVKEAVFRDENKTDGVYKLVDSLSNLNFINFTKIHRVYKSHVEGEYKWGHYTSESYVSGTLEMTLKNKNGDSVVISNGRFDLMFRPY